MALKNMMLQPWLLWSFLFLFHSFLIPICHCQTNPPQNIETFFPFGIPAPSPSPNSPTKPPESVPTPPPSQPSPPPQVAATSRSSTSNSKIAKAVAVTAAATLVVCGLIFFLIHRCLASRRKKEIAGTAAPPGDRRVVPQGNVFERIDGNVRGLIVDENGLDVVYWRKLEGRNSKKELQKEVFHSAPKYKQKQEKEEEENDDAGNDEDIIVVKKSKSIQAVPLLRGKSSTSHVNIFPEENQLNRITSRSSFPVITAANLPASVEKPDSPPQSSTPPPPLSPPTPSPATTLSDIPKSESRPPPPPPPTPDRKSPATSPPPPPIPARKSPAPPPPPPKAVITKPSSKPPPTSSEMPGTTSKNEKLPGDGTSESGNGQLKLKPLHWDKVNTNNVDHSMVWDKIDRGSLRVDDDLMEALFGYVATNRRSPKGKNHSTSSSSAAPAPSRQTFLLDPRKSQNIAIVLKSLAVSREEILDALNEGQGLNADTIEKLSRVSPTEEEQSQILEYNGDPKGLAAAESFLYHTLKAIPSAFKRLNAMLFRSNYDSEIQQIHESLQTLDFSCKELRNRGLFVKLLEAVLKAGNRMNAGTSRGNAQAFSLNSLRKLSDVKSVDGKTTLLHFVVEEVVRSEGKRCVLNRLNRSVTRSSSGNFENYSSEQKEREYIKLGLPIVGGLSSEFSNVKNAALIDYNSLIGSVSALSTQIVRIRGLVSQCGNDRGGKFVKEMEYFLKNAEEEMKLVREEQKRVMQLVKRTTEYYQGGALKDTAENPLQIFVIVKDFLGKVDQTCNEIARNSQKRKTEKASSR